MKRETKLTQQEQEQLAAAQQQTKTSGAQEFASVEEMLRCTRRCRPPSPTGWQNRSANYRLPPRAAGGGASSAGKSA